MTDDMFSREALAGYDRACMKRGVVTIVGAGAAGCNAGQNLALAGVGELRFIDFDVVEPSNLTRSPLFDERRLSGGRVRYKAREAAMGVLACSYAEAPRVRFSTARVEDVGLGGLLGSHAVLAAVDSLSVRAFLADATRLLGIPLVELGFSGTRGHVSVFSNSSNGEPCWRCMHPDVEDGPASCTLYARQVEASGRVPATQPLAATIGGLAAEHLIQAVHGRVPLSGRAFFFDLHTCKTTLLEIATDPDCPGAHRQFGDVHELTVRCEEPLRVVFEAARGFVTEPVVHLPAPFVVEMPCIECGSSVEVGKPTWKVVQPPQCGRCPSLPQLGTRDTVITSTIAADDPLADRRCRSLGLAPGAIFEIEDRATSRLQAVKLAGGTDDLFEMRERARNRSEIATIDKEGTPQEEPK